MGLQFEANDKVLTEIFRVFREAKNQDDVSSSVMFTLTKLIELDPHLIQEILPDTQKNEDGHKINIFTQVKDGVPLMSSEED